MSCRRGGGAGVVTQHPHQAARVRQGAAAGLGQHPQGLLGHLRVAVNGGGDAVGHGDHDGQRVGDDVVHLPGDPAALVGGRQERRLLALQRGACGAGLHLCQPLPLGAGVEPHEHADHIDECQHHEGHGGLDERVALQDHLGDLDRERRGDPRQPRPPGPDPHGKGPQHERHAYEQGEHEHARDVEGRALLQDQHCQDLGDGHDQDDRCPGGQGADAPQRQGGPGGHLGQGEDDQAGYANGLERHGVLGLEDGGQ